MTKDCNSTEAFHDIFNAAVDVWVKDVPLNNPAACKTAAMGVYPAGEKCYDDIVA